MLFSFYKTLHMPILFGIFRPIDVLLDVSYFFAENHTEIAGLER